jgi:hypothetical protein
MFGTVLTCGLGHAEKLTTERVRLLDGDTLVLEEVEVKDIQVSAEHNLEGGEAAEIEDTLKRLQASQDHKTQAEVQRLQALVNAEVAAETIVANENLRTEVYTLQHLEAEKLTDLLQLLDAEVAIEPDLNAIIVTTDARTMETVHDVIQSMDKPNLIPAEGQKNVELIYYILQAFPSAVTPAGAVKTLPTVLEPVLRELKTAFNLESFILEDGLFLRTREGEGGQIYGTLNLAPEGQMSVETKFGFEEIRVQDGENGATVSLSDLNVQLHVESSELIRNWHVQIESSIDVREGQMAVVGKSNTGPNGRAIFVVLSAKVID